MYVKCIAVLLLLCFVASAYSPSDKPNAGIYATNWENTGWDNGAALSKALMLPNEGAFAGSIQTAITNTLNTISEFQYTNPTNTQPGSVAWAVTNFINSARNFEVN